MVKKMLIMQNLPCLLKRGAAVRRDCY